MSIDIDFGLEKTYTTTINRTVGATTRTGVRGTFPQPAPDDLNSIWIAPNGNDGNAGTEAAPVLTIPVAQGKLGGAFTNIQFFRNSYVGDLDWVLSANLALTTGQTMQVEDGEIANLDFASGFYVTVTGTVTINGFHMTFENESPFGILISVNSDCIVENCDIIVPAYGVTGTTGIATSAPYASSGTLTARFNYISAFLSISYVAEKTATISNNILISNKGTYSGVAESPAISIIHSSTAGAVATSEIENNLFIDFGIVIVMFMSADHPSAPGNTINITGCLFEKCGFLIGTNFIDEPGDQQYSIMNFDYCLDRSFDFIDYYLANGIFIPFPTELIINITNPIEKDTPLMLVDAKNAFSTSELNQELARLQMTGKATIDGSDRYFIDSPLVGILDNDPGFIWSEWLFNDLGGAPLLEGVDEERGSGFLWSIAKDTDTIYKSDMAGNLITSFTTISVLAGTTLPEGIAYDDADDAIWFCDASLDKIIQCSKAGALITSFDTSVYDAAALAPKEMAYDMTTDTLWIVDGLTGKSYNVSKTGTLISSFSNSDWGGSGGNLTFTIAPDGTIWIIPHDTDVVTNLSRSLDVLSSFDGNTIDGESLFYGGGMAANGTLWLAGQTNSKVYNVDTLPHNDLSPFIEHTDLTSEAFNDTISLDWPAKSLQVTNDLKNPVNIIDIKGNPHTAYDARRRRFVLTWGDGVHISNRQMKALFYMIADTGSKKFYPLGIAANIFTPDNLTAGTFSDTDDSILVTEAAANNMVEDHWRGFWVTIGSDDFYIESNDSTKLYLVDKLGAGFPANGAVNFIVSYILVKTPAEAYNINQTNFTEFLKGGAWRENDTDAQNYDLTISAINFDEVEDREEGVE